MNTCTILITPEMAKKWLENNPNNRPVKMKRVEAFARDMKAGNWFVTHQGIAFDTDGNLLDGQHRLFAVALSGTPTLMNVTTGVPRETMIAVDVGTPRDMRDAIVINEMYDNDTSLRQRGCIGVLNTMLHLGYNGAQVYTNSERAKMIDKIGPELKAVWDASSTSKAALSAPIRAAALAAVLNGENIEDIKLFFQVFSRGDTTGCFGCNTPAAFNFARYILKAKANRMTIARGRLYLLAQNAIYQFIRGDKQNIAKGGGNLSNFRYPVADKIKAILEGEE